MGLELEKRNTNIWLRMLFGEKAGLHLSFSLFIQKLLKCHSYPSQMPRVSSESLQGYIKPIGNNLGNKEITHACIHGSTDIERV